ncbi:MAG: hypothetical protein AAGE98_18710 [Actinomycetota bacterium]
MRSSEFDIDLLSTMVGAAKTALPLVLDAAEAAGNGRLDISDVDVSRALVGELVNAGTQGRALAWTAEVLEVASQVMTHHRESVPISDRPAWAEVNLVLRTMSIASAEAVGRVPGTSPELAVDILDLTGNACRELGALVEPATIVRTLASLEAVEHVLPLLAEAPGYPSDQVEMVAVALRPVADHSTADPD